MSAAPRHTLRARRMGLFTQDEPVVVMRADSHVSRAEGLAPRSQVIVRAGPHEVTATLYQVEDIMDLGDVALSEAAWRRLGVAEGASVTVRHAPPLESMALVRRRIYGGRLERSAFDSIIGDVVQGRYADAHLAAFLTSCATFPLDSDELISLTGSMVDAGKRLRWDKAIVVDKHCIGGLPGNRTTPIVVAICAAVGLTMPKTSSRAITSPAGTADTMETLAPVDLDAAQMRKVIETEGGCVVWGGGVELSPADEVVSRIGRALDMDGEGQMVASVLSKKIAAGSNRVIIDLPVGPTAKLRTQASAEALVAKLCSVGMHFGLQVRCLITEGLQPIGRGVGPSLEARDILAVLQNDVTAPADLRQKAINLAGAVIDLAGAAGSSTGAEIAKSALNDGRAWAKFQRICEAQGGMRKPGQAKHQRDLKAEHSGCIVHMDNRKLARLAKLAGAPASKTAGIDLHVHLGDTVVSGQPLVTLHAADAGELDYAWDFALANANMLEVEP